MKVVRLVQRMVDWKADGLADNLVELMDCLTVEQMVVGLVVMMVEKLVLLWVEH